LDGVRRMCVETKTLGDTAARAQYFGSMPRARRDEIPNGYYHLTMSGNNGQPLWRNGDDRAFFLSFLGRAVVRYRWRCYAYVLMTNHYHLVIQLTATTLADGMRWLNGLYAQVFNKRHDVSGHLFGERYRTTFIEDAGHFAEACRYVVCNPVRAGLCSHPADWIWSSFNPTVGSAPAPPFLAVSRLLAHLDMSRCAYQSFVEESLYATGLPISRAISDSAASRFSSGG
jgi:putative transposase